MVLSVLVPVYNVAPYLERCLGSLLTGIDFDYEIILVDDGSTDGSGALCDELAQAHSHIRVLHQENKGLVAARNVALHLARGRYITFVDSDDWVGAGLLAGLVADLEQHPEADIAAGAVVRNTSEKRDWPFLSPNNGVLSGQVAFSAMVRKVGLHWYLWGKVYRRELFLNNDTDEAVTVFEDLARVWPLMQRCRSFVCDNRYAYHYFVNTAGMTEKRCDLNPASWRVLKRVVLECQDETCKYRLADYYLQYFLRQTFEMYYVDPVKYERAITDYIEEFSTTVRGLEWQPSVMSEPDYEAIAGGYDSCIAYYSALVSCLEDKLSAILRKAQPVYVYGTGIVAQYVADIMENLHIEPVAYIVSDGKIRQQRFMRKPVLYWSEMDTNRACDVVLALTGKAKKVVHSALNFNQGEASIHDIEFPPIVF